MFQAFREMIKHINFRDYLPLLLVTICFMTLYNQVIHKMIQDWSIDDNFSHGFMIPFISGYLIWQQRKRLSDTLVNPSNWGIILIATSLLFFFIAYIGAEQFTMRFSMILLILSISVYFAGWKFTKAIFPPVAYLIFMIPIPAIIWNKIAFPLKIFATKMAVDVIHFFEIPAYREGNIIHLTNTTLEVVDACSGLRSLMSLLALSAAFALISNHTRIGKLILILSAIPIAIFTNIVRLSSTAALARHFGPQVAEGFLHDTSGILVFGLAFALLYGIHSCLNRIKGFKWARVLSILKSRN